MLRLKQVLTLIFWFPLTTLAQTGPEIPDYPADRIADNIYVIHGPLELPNPKNQGFMNNPGIVVTSKGVVLLDPGSSVQSGEMVLRAVKKVSSRPVVAVFNSHIHGDHWLGNLEILYSSVKRYYDEGLSDFEMKPQVAEALKDYADWSGFDEELGKHISLTYLQIEEAEF